MEENCDNPEKSQENSETPTPECSNALGRPTRSNVHRPRVVAELSLVSALTAAPEQSPEKTLNNEDVDEQGIRCLVVCERVFSNRRRRVLLARIERMFSILLILDEVSLSLEKVVVQNDARARLLDYQQKLIDQLTSELFKSPGRTAKEIYETLPEDNLFHLSDNIFTIRKGMRLWPLVLRYLPTKIKTNYLAEFINDFLHLHKLWPTTMNEAAAIFYPHLREIIYQMGYINDFLEICFPDALKMNSIADNSELTISISDNLISLLECKLGLSLIFCLMDACARASNPTDPSYFIQFGAYFIYANSLVVRNSQTDDCDHVMESPSRYRLITDDHLNVFCELAKGIKVMSNNSNNNTNEIICVNKLLKNNGTYRVLLYTDD
ncbi:unnamed protein product [Heterobilharzia americana]|nr:unnamed protein product [Heterobilharzia americana]